MSITYTQFLAYSGYTATTVPNEAYVKDLLDTVVGILEDDLNIKFSLTANYTDEYSYRGLDYIVIGGWQKPLEIKINKGGTLSDPLTEYKNYRLKHYKDRSREPIIGIQFINSNLCFYDTVLVSGTYGWSNGLPLDLRQIVFASVKATAEGNKQMTESGGSGVLSSTRSVTLSESFSGGDELAKQLFALGFDPLGIKSIQKVLQPYKDSATTHASLP